jgi:cytochrome c553
MVLSCGDPATGVMFRNDAGNPVCLNNLSNRAIRPALTRCVVCHKTEAKHT